MTEKIRLINKDALKERCITYINGDRYVTEWRIEDEPEVDAVPLIELLELRDNLYETDRITMNGLKMLNSLIARYDGERKGNG